MLYVLGESDVAFLQKLKQAYEKGFIQGPPNASRQEPVTLAPDLYLAKTPSGGIPAMVGSVAGSAMCEICRLDPETGVASAILTAGAPWEKKVFNLSDSCIYGSYVRVQRMKSGAWVVENDQYLVEGYLTTECFAASDSMWNPSCALMSTFRVPDTDTSSTSSDASASASVSVSLSTSSGVELCAEQLVILAEDVKVVNRSIHMHLDPGTYIICGWINNSYRILYADCGPDGGDGGGGGGGTAGGSSTCCGLGTCGIGSGPLGSC